MSGLIDRLFALSQVVGVFVGAWGGWRGVEWLRGRSERGDEGSRD